MKLWVTILTHNINTLIYQWNVSSHHTKSFKTLMLYTKAMLILSITSLFGCSSTNKVQDSIDYCTYADTTSKYYNPNKLTQNQLEECEIRLMKILEIQEIQVKIQKTRPLESDALTQATPPIPLSKPNAQPLFDIQEPTKSILSASRKTPQTTVRTVKESIKPIYHTDAGASVNSGNQSTIIVTKAGNHRDSIIQNAANNTQQVTPNQDIGSVTLAQTNQHQYANPVQTDGLSTLLEYQSNSRKAVTQEAPSIKQALSEAKAVSESPTYSANNSMKTDEQKIIAANIQESESLILIQKLKENKPSNRTNIASKNIKEARENIQSETNSNDSSNEPLDNDAQPIPTFEPLPGF